MTVGTLNSYYYLDRDYFDVERVTEIRRRESDWKRLSLRHMKPPRWARRKNLRKGSRERSRMRSKEHREGTYSEDRRPGTSPIDMAWRCQDHGKKYQAQAGQISPTQTCHAYPKKSHVPGGHVLSALELTTSLELTTALELTI